MVGTNRTGDRGLPRNGGDAVAKLDRLTQRGEGGDAGLGTKEGTFTGLPRVSGHSSQAAVPVGRHSTFGVIRSGQANCFK